MKFKKIYEKFIKYFLPRYIKYYHDVQTAVDLVMLFSCVIAWCIGLGVLNLTDSAKLLLTIICFSTWVCLGTIFWFTSQLE